jgi:hypothetical protein
MRIGPPLLLAFVVACGGQDRPLLVKQPAGCVEAFENVDDTPQARDIVLGKAILVGLKDQQRLPWTQLWIPAQKMGMVKIPILVPEGQSLTLTIPPVSRGIIGLDYDSEAPRTRHVTRAQRRATFTACYGESPQVFFPGRIVIARPICEVPLDWRYGSERGRLHLSFGRAC